MIINATNEEAPKLLRNTTNNAYTNDTMPFTRFDFTRHDPNFLTSHARTPPMCVFARNQNALCAIISSGATHKSRAQIRLERNA